MSVQAPERPVTTTDWPRLLRRLARTTALGAICFLALILAVGALSGPALRAMASSIDFNLDTPESTALRPLAERSRVLASDGSLLAVLHDEVDRRVVPLDAVPDHVRQAVITAEDRKFYEHSGYDLQGIGRAMVANFQARSIQQGGSTITQQLAKMNFVGDEQTLDRKISELMYAIALEEQMEKDELLERYLNQVYFGAGAYGISAAAEEFFRLEPEELTVEQAALLAGLIQSPGSLDPRAYPDRALARRNAILEGMRSEGYVDAAKAERLQQLPLEVQPPLERETAQPYWVEAVKREFFANTAFGEERADRIDLLFSGGLDIQTTLDPHHQAVAAEVVQSHLGEAGGPTAAIASVDPRTGRITALYSGANFSEEQFDLATQGRRQPGSAFKPFVLAAALEAGFPLSMRLEGTGPIELDYTGAPEPWEVDNYAGSSYGTVNLREALVKSVNTAFAQLILAVGPEHAADVARRLGINIDSATAGLIVPAMALGGFERGVTPLEMASAYGVFANAGVRMRPYLIAKVTDANGEVIYEHEPEPEAVLEPAVAEVMLDIMGDVVQRGTATRARLPRWPVAGKTGTTQIAADAWFIGTTSVQSTAVWMGHPDAQVPMRGMTGGNLPARMWRAFMMRTLEGIDPIPFPEADTSLRDITEGARVEVPDVRRMDEGEALAVLAQSKLVANARQVPSGAPAGTVIWQSPNPGNEARVGDTVTIGVSNGSPVRTSTRSSSSSESSSPSEDPPPPPPSEEESPPPPADEQPRPEPEPEPEPPPEDPDPVPAPAPAPGRDRGGP